MRRTYASSNDINSQKKRRKKETTLNLFTLLSENHEEVADTDQVPVLKELVEEREKMTLHMRRCSYALFAVGATQLAWGGFMFFALETPLNHAVLTEICMSALVICGLAYQLKQAVKPVQLFTDMDDFQKTKSIFLSRQITRMLGAFFHRGYGIAFVLSFTLGAHALTCIRFLM
ncbi:hypothetical protein KP509_03G092200 [Ceratopteris richardii]|nr:hypothetical protein KP509_03G092200 [Ceratopteris richardii]